MTHFDSVTRIPRVIVAFNKIVEEVFDIALVAIIQKLAISIAQHIFQSTILIRKTLCEGQLLQKITPPKAFQHVERRAISNTIILAIVPLSIAIAHFT